MATLPVYFEQRRVGTIDVDKHGPGFTYDPSWIALRGAFPLSITMPLRSERIASDTFLPWAANLLPESEQLRTLGQLLGMARGDVIGLLSAIGGDTAGALSIGQPGRTASVQWRQIDEPKDLEELIEELPSKPFLVGEEGVSMSLAGVQSKLAVAVDQTGRVCIPMNGSPSTHILKPDAPRFEGSVQNEAFCLNLGSTNENRGAERHDRPGRQANLFARQALRPNRGQRPLAPPTPRRLLSGAREAAIRKVRSQPDRDSWTSVKGHVRADSSAHAANRYCALAGYGCGQCTCVQYRRPCQELRDHHPGQRRVNCTYVRRHVQRGLERRHKKSRPENCRQEPRRSPQCGGLAAIRA
jgi:HipA-like protein